MNRNQVDNWRTDTQARLEELTVMSAKQSGEITHIKQTVDEIKVLVGTEWKSSYIRIFCIKHTECRCVYSSCIRFINRMVI